ncbi:MAG TPA: DUF1287 domain-containing protein [Kofleriaceae bacterium]
MIFTACGGTGEADPAPPATPAKSAPAPSAEAVAGEVRLGVPDKGIFSDLDDKVQIKLPAGLTAERVSARIDGRLLVLLIDGFPRKAYPLSGTAKLVVGKHELALRPGDKAELQKLLTAERLTVAAKVSDRDGDGLSDPLDVFIGAKKTALNADAYTEGYKTIKYPMGDVPREMGVCTDVVIRAVRNAGIDLQKALHEDIKRAKKAYPMVKGRGNPNIDHRRVKTILPYFVRHWEKHTIALADTNDPLRPGDIVFMDTFPSKAGPDHIGIVSDTIGESGHPMIINNWTNGTVTTEMDLLAFVPLTHRFRLPE